MIVARSYVFHAGTIRDPIYSTPDDLSPRDRQGHGTAIAMIAAGVQNTGPLGTITGVAPKAFLGNYKVFGSPGVNEYTYRSVWIQALTDAVNDGMDIVTLSLGEGDPAFFGPLDTGTERLRRSRICDVGAQAVENATSLGTPGGGGRRQWRRSSGSTASPAYRDSPGTAPSAITVGASANSHLVYQTVRVNGRQPREISAG